MIWGYLTAYGPGFMCKINGIMDQHIYKQILEDYLLQTIKWYKMDPERVIFQQDCDSKHMARSTQEWLDKQSFDILEWPPQSPNLSPIENLWAILKQKLNQYDRPPNGVRRSGTRLTRRIALGL